MTQDAIKKLEASLQADIQKRNALTDSIKDKQKRLAEMKEKEILRQANVLIKQGVDVSQAFQAIQSRDLDMLITIIEEGVKQDGESV